MKNLDLIGKELFNKVRGRFPSVTIGNAKGEVTNIPAQARFFDFEYKEGDQSLGKISISLDEETINVMYAQDIVEDQDSFTKEKWFNFLKEMRVFAKKRMLKFDTRNITKSNLNKRDYKFLAQQGGEQTMSESKLYGTSRISYQNIGNARVTIKHTESINQEQAGGRTQKVGTIYVENAEGERFKYPFKHLNGARAMARHVSEGGKPFDDFGKHITGLSEELANLKKFKTYMNRSSVMAEGLVGYLDIVKERIGTVKKTIESLQKESYYKEAFEGFEVPVMEEVPDDVRENWIDELTIRQFNEDLADVFPYIYKLVSEATRAKEINPEDLEEGPMDWIKDKVKGIRDKNKAAYQQELDDIELLKTVLASNGYDKGKIRRIEQGCLNEDARVCLYNEIRENALESGDMEMEVLRIGKELNSGWTTRAGTTDEEIEQSFDEMMGQFAEDEHHGNDKMYDKKGLSVKEGQTPVPEYILSLFDRETGQFPKGETAVLTAIEKDYGEQFINPAKAFIERIQETYKTYTDSNDIEEDFDPKHFDSEIGYEAVGDDGESTECTVSYTATIIDGKPVVHPKSIRLDCPMDGNSKLGYDADMDLEMQDMNDIMQTAQIDANEQWADRNGKDKEKDYGSSFINGVNMDGKKRWKQTSLLPQDAIRKYGKQNVRVKKGALRNGDDMVEVFVSDHDNEGFTDKQIRMAYGILNDKRYKGSNLTAAYNAIEKIAKGLTKHKGVANAMRATSESEEFDRMRELAGL